MTTYPEGTTKADVSDCDVTDWTPRNHLQRLADELQLKETDVELALYLDQQDPLAPLRGEFFYPKNHEILGVDLKKVNPNDDSIYFNGNSLGLQPKNVHKYMEVELQKWAQRGIQGQFTGDIPWSKSDDLIAPRLASLVGASPSEISIMNGLTVNLHLLLLSFYRPTSGRYKILMESKAFPSDHYVIESQIRYHGYDPKTSMLCLEPRQGEHTLRLADILQTIAEEGAAIAVILMPGVQYFTGQKFDMKAITRAGHAKGCYVGFDLAHSIGNHPLHLHDWDVDFSVWCSYKYLCAGAGALGGAYIHSKFDNSDLKRLIGWWGHKPETRFQMKNDDNMCSGIQGYRLTNPSIFAIVPLIPFLEIYEKTSMEAMRAKSLLLTGYFEVLLCKLQEDAAVNGWSRFEFITPKEPEERGAQLSLLFHDNVVATKDQLIRYAIVCDFRAPNVLRFAPCPLYNSFTHVHECYVRLSAAMQDFKNL